MHLLLISGSLRARSTNTAAMRTAATLAPAGVTPTIYDDLASLPHFNPDDDHDPLPAPVGALRSAVHASDAVLFSAPEYAGGLPGAFKNALDWLIGDADPGSIYEKPVAWLNASTRGAPNAHAELRAVLGFAHATIVESACVHVPVSESALTQDGTLADDHVRDEIASALRRFAAEISSFSGR
jgi:NAD(P)H-dependent FMN reductase